MDDAASKPDYYSILAVPENAGFDEIKQAYRVAAKQNHPDAGGSPAAMKLLNQAYDTLGDPQHRAEYDAERRLEADLALAREAPADEAGMLYEDAAVIERAEELRWQAAQVHDRRQAWARQSAAATLSGCVLWSVLSLVLGFLMASQLTTQLVVMWSIINFGLFSVMGFGITGVIWPEHRLEILDLGFHRRLMPTHRWWKRTAVTVLLAGLTSLVVAIAVLVLGRPA